MSKKRPRLAYGSWPSPITAAAVASDRVRLNDLQLDGDDVYWIEGRPLEAGRCVVVRHRDGRGEDVLPQPFSARTSVHEYGGGALLAANGSVYFCNDADRRLHLLVPGAAPEPLTPDLGDVRFADMELDARRSRLLAVVEDHRGAKVINDVRAIPLHGGEPHTIVAGNDFYSNPRVSPDGSRLAWITWNQPNMPWDGTELWVAELNGDGQPRNPRLVAGGTRESIFQPAWSPQGVLHFVSDRSGWWNLYRLDGAVAHAVAPMEADCGQPAWIFGLATYAFLDGGRVALAACQDGVWSLGTVPPDSTGWTAFGLPYTSLGGGIHASNGRIAFVGGGLRESVSVVIVDAATGEHRVLRRGSSAELDDSVLSTPTAITFPGWEGATAHAFYYAPRNEAVEPELGALPPLLVHAHGGPTSSTSTALDRGVQYWTSRGIAYLDVNYGGSDGYGRSYRERLNGQEGIVDVGDCIAGALHLAETGVVDRKRLIIDGGSAGGYIVLCAMTFHDVFAAGASLYGISDMETLAGETHKFEARYFDTLVGPYPEARDVYYNRSPIHFIDRVRRAVILFQGLDDPVVPANQSEKMFAALRDAGIPCAYVAFPGERHGFRQASSIVRTLEAELYFFGRVLGFPIADDVAPLDIANLERRHTT